MDGDRKNILSILLYGEKRQQEIIELINRSGRVVRKKLDDLEQTGKISKEKRGGGTYYSLPDQNKIVQPKPPADDKQVEQILYDAASGIQLISGKKLLTESDMEILDIDTFSENLLIDTVSSLFHLWEIGTHRYHVLSNRDNRNLYFKIFDALIEDEKLASQPEKAVFANRGIPEEKFLHIKKSRNTFTKTAKVAAKHADSSEEAEADCHVCTEVAKNPAELATHIRLAYTGMVRSAKAIYDNYQKGKEVEQIRKDFVDRCDKIEQFIPSNTPIKRDISEDIFPNKGSESFYQIIYFSLSDLLNDVDRETYKQLLRNRLASGNFKMMSMYTELFWVYDQNNEISEMFGMLEELQRNASNPIKQEIMELEEMMRKRYKLESGPSAQGRPLQFEE